MINNIALVGGLWDYYTDIMPLALHLEKYGYSVDVYEHTYLTQGSCLNGYDLTIAQSLGAAKLLNLSPDRLSKSTLLISPFAYFKQQWLVRLLYRWFKLTNKTPIVDGELFELSLVKWMLDFPKSKAGQDLKSNTNLFCLYSPDDETIDIIKSISFYKSPVNASFIGKHNFIKNPEQYTSVTSMVKYIEDIIQNETSTPST